MKTDIGRYMLGACAIIKHPSEDKVLIIKRAGDHRKDEWEFPGGRIDQFEEITEGLKREIREETGLKNISIERALRFWHIYRGEKTKDNEIFGFTFSCTTSDTQVTIDPEEHSEFQWVHPSEAIALIADDGVRMDIEPFMNASSLLFTSVKDENLL